jgi:hypothetical protein
MQLRSGRTLILLAAVVVCLVTRPAAAYIGPGAGLTAIGALLAVIAAVGVAVFGFIWYPIKGFLRRIRTKTEDADGEKA